LFQAGSISKPVAATGALYLVEHGKLALDEDVNRKLVSWKVPENEFTKDQKVTLRRLMSHSAGLTVHGDAVGNVVGVLPGDGTTPRHLLTGSHYDTVINAGKYDGRLGILLPIAVAGAMRRAGLHLPYPLEIIAFAEEEGVRFKSTFLGSRAVAGQFEPDVLQSVDAQGISLRAAMAAVSRRDDADRSRFGLWGTDLGGYVALVVAESDPRVKAIAVESAYDHPQEMATVLISRQGVASLPLLGSFARKGFYWFHYSERQTPPVSANLDRLAGEGVRFTNAYSSTPTCTPARAALLSGLAPWNHGMLRYAQVADRYPVEMPRALRDAGYYTTAIGKLHYHPQRNGHGYHQALLDESGRVESPDIRAGMAMLVAALCADGESTIDNVGQIERGYERIDERLNALGAAITRVDDRRQ